MVQLSVTAWVLNVRAGPGVRHPVLTRITKGTRILQVGRTADGRWLEVRVQHIDATVIGWVSSSYVEVENAAADVVKPAWLVVAERELGIAEYPGPADNPRVVQYHATTTLGARDDEVPWCSSFVNWCMAESGVAGTRSAAARSWLGWGQPLPRPQLGCVVIFTRGASPTSGHVALYVRSRGAVLDVLGGNQSNQVRVSGYPTARVLDYRWPLQA